jgi:hypothetical protein
MIRFVNIQKTSTVTHLKLDVDADRSLYKPPPLEKYQALINETYNYITSTSKTITMSTPTTPTTSLTSTPRTLTTSPMSTPRIPTTPPMSKTT